MVDVFFVSMFIVGCLTTGSVIGIILSKLAVGFLTWAIGPKIEEPEEVEK